MGLFKHKKQEETAFKWMTVNEALSRHKLKGDSVTFEDVMDRCEECCEQYSDAEAQVCETRNEYEAITSYLTDMQLIDDLPGEQRKQLETTARDIVALNEERMNYQREKDTGISTAQMLNIERYEEEIPKQLEVLREQESYQQLIREDLKQLEGEKGAITYERESLTKRRNFFKNLSIVCCALIGLLFMILLCVKEYFKADMTVPFYMTGILAVVIIIYIVYGLRDVKSRARLEDAKMNKAILLLNKVKIKYVNCTNSIDFMYEKYNINSLHELEFQWKQYTIMLSEQERYKRNTEKLEAANHLLMLQLENYGIKDAEIWIYQPEAILDNKEMVEVRHHLNERRRKVRERLEYLEKHFDIAREELRQIRDFRNEYKRDVASQIKKHGIVLEENA